MKNFLYMNEELIERDLPLRSIFYGEGLFETFRWNKTAPVFLNKHLERMKQGAELLKIPFPGKSKLKKRVEKAIEKSDLEDAYAKLCLLSSSPAKFYSEANEESVLVMTRKYKKPNKRMKVCIASAKRHSSSPSLYIKSINYLENVLTRRKSINQGYDDAIFLNEREEVSESTSANLFWVKEDTLYTPTVECGLLPGITREALISLAPNLGFEVEEGNFKLDKVYNSEGIFLTNALMGIAEVTKIGEKETSPSEKLFKKLRKSLFEELGWTS